MKNCWIGGIQYTLGELRDIDELPELATDPERLEVFKLRGFQRYARSRATPSEMAGSVLNASIEATNTARSSIDVLLYGTDLTSERLFSHAGINELLATNGLVRAFPIGVSLSACANATSMLDLGVSLVRAGLARCVACVIVGMSGVSASRVQNVALLSDGAVACMLTNTPADYQVLGAGRSSAPSMTRLSVERHTQEYFAAGAQNLRVAIDEALGPLQLTQSDLARVLNNNYALSLQHSFLKLAGFRPQQGWFDNLPRFGHAFSADTLINLSDCTGANALAARQRCLLIGNVPSMCCSIVVEKT